MMARWEMRPGDWVGVLRTVPAGVFQSIITSPPYWGQRDYGTACWIGGDPDCDHVAGPVRNDAARATPGGRGGSFRGGNRQFRATCGKCSAVRQDRQIGLEATPEEYIANLVEGFQEVYRVLRDDGTCWVNIGDVYAAGGMGYGGKHVVDHAGGNGGWKSAPPGCKMKDLVGLPWMFAFAMRAAGWYLRQDIIWDKPNVMPESVSDRCTKSHEYFFLFTKSGDSLYWTHPDLGGTRTEPAPDYRWVNEMTGDIVKDEPPAWREKIICPSCAGRGYECGQCNGRGKIRLWHRVNLWLGHDYFYDAEAITEPGVEIRACGKNSRERTDRDPGHNGHKQTNGDSNFWHDPAPDAQGPVISMRNRRSVWRVANSSFREAHFATFPPELISPCILAGTSEKGCCPKCGAPYDRLLERPELTVPGVHHGKNNVEERTAARRILENLSAKRAAGNHHEAPFSRPRTLGWTATCDCNAGAAVPCITCDPFDGAGTTCVESLRLGRSFFGCDLNPAYVEMARRRTINDAPMFNAPAEGSLWPSV